MTADWLPLAQRILSCEWADRRGRDGWCETHDDPWPCDRAQEAADVLAEELDQPTKEQKMGKTTDDEGGIVRCECGRAVPCRHCPTTPTPIDPADIRPGDVFRFTHEATCEQIDKQTGDIVSTLGDVFSPVTVEGTAWHLVSRPDPDAEAVEALERAALPKDDSSPAGFQGWWNILAALRESGWDVVRRAET